MDEAFIFTQGWPYRPAPRGARISRAELEAREQALLQAPLFSGIPKRIRKSIARVTAVSSYDEGQPVITEGVTESTMFVILEGDVRVTRRGRTVARFGPGNFFGEISLVDPGPRTASVVAESSLRCLSLAGEDFREILQDEPVLLMRLVGELARRLRETDRASFG